MVGVVSMIRRIVHRIMNYSYTGIQKRKIFANDMYTIAQQLQ